MVRVHHQSLGGLEIVTIASGAPWNQNCHLIAERSSGAFVVVDPGCDSGELRDAIRDIGTQPTHLLVTHGHPDHLGAAAAVSELLDLDCRVASADKRVVRHAPAYGVALGGLRVRIPERVAFLGTGEVLPLGSTAISVVPVPGHTPGSVAFVIDSLALTGDALLREHIGRTDFPGSDLAELVRSVDRLIDGLPDEALILAGHGRPWTSGEARRWWRSAGRSHAIAAAAS